jgi:RNA polymerase sigma-70 factor, ECF subfamily
MATSPDADASDEGRLIAGVAAGDREAFRQLYARYSTPLFSLAIKLVGDTGAAEEALQDSFVKIWRHASNYDERKSRPFSWAVTILRRTCIDHLRKQRRSPPGISLPDSDAASPEFATGELARQATESNEASTRLREALVTLLSPQREAIELALFSTLTHREIAVRLGQPVGTIKTWIRRGLIDLRARLGETVP